MKAFDAIVAGLLALVGVRSLVHWLRRPFHPSTLGERLLYVLNITCRAGFWFALAAFFLAWAVVDEPQTVGGFIVLPIALAGGQLLTGFLISRGDGVEGGADPPPSPSVDEAPAEPAEVGRSNGHAPEAKVEP